MESKTMWKKMAAVGIGALVLGGFAGANMFPRTETVTTTVTVEKPVEVVKEVVKEVEVPVEVIKEVEVITNNDEYDSMLRVLTNTDGDVGLITDDLEDLSIAEVSDRFVFAADAIAIAEQKVRERGMDELDGEVVGAVTLDEDDMGRFRLDDEPGYVMFSEYDFAEKDAEVVVKANVRQDGTTYDVEFAVSIRDGEYRRMEVLSIVPRP